MYCKINSPKHHITLLLNILIIKKIKKTNRTIAIILGDKK